jgi:predicted HAD superfamily Cof-like phosphohydrolase
MFSEAQKAVHEFHDKFQFSIPTKPTLLPMERVETRAKWLSEEIEELVRAQDIVDQVDAVADIIYFALGIFVEMGIEGSPVFELVHQANMQKLGDNGQPMRDVDGKIVKPADWISPRERIRDLLSESDIE